MDLEEALETGSEEGKGSETEEVAGDSLDRDTMGKAVPKEKGTRSGGPVALKLAEVVVGEDRRSVGNVAALQGKENGGKRTVEKFWDTPSKREGKQTEKEERVVAEDKVGNRKSVPVYKWGISSSGEGNVSAATFIANVEELREARGITEQELFQSVSDLLTGKALTWHRSAKHSLFSWENYKARCLKVFLPPTYQEI